jgi:hypothetical protein
VSGEESPLRKAVEVGARALPVDFWTDPSHTQPLFAALMAAQFLVVAGGDVYMLSRCGAGLPKRAGAWLTSDRWLVWRA